MNENKTIINWYPGQVSDTNIPNDKKGIFPFSEIANREIKIRHISDESIARCNKNIIDYLEYNKRERQETIEGKYNDETIKVKSLRK